MSVSVITAQRTRFRAIDGLRGIAALSVVIYHFSDDISAILPSWIPAWLSAIAERGFLGVETFFVISGFVIAYSVRNGDHTPRYLGLFALRRAIRLDPPYWFAIVVQIILIALSAALMPSVNTSLPGTAQILSHFIYAQDILGYGNILGVFWTLCFEIQFYLLFVGLLVFWQAIGGRLGATWRTPLAACGLGALFALSLFFRFSGHSLPVPGISLPRWFQFFLGVMAWWAVSGVISLRTLVAAYFAVAATLMAYRADPVQVVPLIVSAFIVVVGRRDALDRVFAGRGLQFGGRISYSLYLLHSPIGDRWIGLVNRLAGARFGPGWAWLTFCSAIGISVATSAVAWRLIEAPTIRLSKRIILPTRRRTPAGATDTESTPTIIEVA